VLDTYLQINDLYLDSFELFTLFTKNTNLFGVERLENRVCLVKIVKY